MSKIKLKNGDLMVTLFSAVLSYCQLPNAKMGTSQSSRRVVVEDGETTGVVKVQESLYFCVGLNTSFLILLVQVIDVILHRPLFLCSRTGILLQVNRWLTKKKKVLSSQRIFLFNYDCECMLYVKSFSDDTNVTFWFMLAPWTLTKKNAVKPNRLLCVVICKPGFYIFPNINIMFL